VVLSGCSTARGVEPALHEVGSGVAEGDRLAADPHAHARQHEVAVVGAPWTLRGQAGMRQALQLQHAQFACGQAHAHAIRLRVGRLTARQHGSVVQNRDGRAAFRRH
jgi:hypothetical protein